MRKLTALLLLLPVLASADPGAATRYLMNEPASLMDIGIHNLNHSLLDLRNHWPGVYKSLDGQPEDFSALRLSAEYWFRDDQIRVHVSAYTHSDSGKKYCNEIILWLRHQLPLKIVFAFSHSGYQNPNLPDDLYDGIEERVNLFCNIHRVKPIGGEVRARGSLNGTEVYFSEEPQ